MDKKVTYGVLIDPKNERISVEPFIEKEKPLQQMYHLVGCNYVELVRVQRGIDLYVDEEGLLNNSRENVGAFSLGNMEFVGRGLLMTDDKEGNTIGFSEADAKRLVENITGIVELY